MFCAFCILRKILIRGILYVEVGSLAGKTSYKNDWQKKNCERISLVVKLGSKNTIKAHAESRGESVNGFINRAIQETIERDNAAFGGTVGRIDSEEEAGN